MPPGPDPICRNKFNTPPPQKQEPPEAESVNREPSSSVQPYIFSGVRANHFFVAVTLHSLTLSSSLLPLASRLAKPPISRIISYQYILAPYIGLKLTVRVGWMMQITSNGSPEVHHLNSTVEHNEVHCWFILFLWLFFCFCEFAIRQWVPGRYLYILSIEIGIFFLLSVPTIAGKQRTGNTLYTRYVSPPRCNTRYARSTILTLYEPGMKHNIHTTRLWVFSAELQ